LFPFVCIYLDFSSISFFTTIPLYLVGMSYFMKRQSGEWVLPHKETMGNVMTDAKVGAFGRGCLSRALCIAGVGPWVAGRGSVGR